MAREIIFYENYFLDFYIPLENKVKMKIKYVLELIKQVEMVPAKFLSPITGYEGLFEIRVEYESNIYLIFCCFDKWKLVVLFNGFQKKSQKTPKQEIEKAMRLKQKYFATKNKM
ncbi:type II toxin-antitoxin system RelE/ParE family toxin [Mariniphaga sp.]|uniref:type II toxin-antitoxin system RelE/ParE family toxin n=1 Tax=Mariniphaga sp. TaxID=1954475 RepID=UPI003567B1A5